MTTEPLPLYLAAARPVSRQGRSPWYASTMPTYAGVFLWIVYYETLGAALPLGGLAAALIGLVLAALVSYGLFFYVFGMLGMQTGLPLYVVGSSTFGARGGYAIPGLFMGILQIGWFAVNIFFVTRLIMQALGLAALTPLDPDPANQGFSMVFLIVALIWGYAFAALGASGIGAITKVAQFAPFVPLAMLIVAAASGTPGISAYPPAHPLVSLPGLAGILLVVQLTIGYFATAGAAGVDIGMNNRSPRDVVLGGLLGIALPCIAAGGLALLTVAGAHGLRPNLVVFTFSGALPTVSPGLASMMYALFAVSTMPTAAFCAYVMSNSLSTMIPSVSRAAWTLGCATVAIALAVSGLAGNLEPFFGLIGAAFGPVCGAMAADWLLAGRRWPGPRRGVSIPGYAAWLVGFLIGISNNGLIAGLLGRAILPAWHPTAVYSFAAGFAIYAALAKAGLEAPCVSYTLNT